MSEKTHIKKIHSSFFEQEFPADLVFVEIWLASTIAAIYFPFLNETPVRIVLAIPVVLLIPGYCILAALFPKKDDISHVERIALSIGLSIAVVPLMGLGLNFTTGGIRLASILVSLTFLTYAIILVAYYRRAILPVEERFRIPLSAISDRIRQQFLLTGENRTDRLLSAVLSLVMLVAIITTVYVITSAPLLNGERFSEFYILGENRTAADYPALIIAGQNYPMYVVVRNHEFRNMPYTIETWLLRTEFDNVTNTSRITAMDPGERLAFVLAHNQTWIIPFNLSVRNTGYDRVEFLLFNETVPGLDVIRSARINASYRDLNLWITVY